MKRIVLWALTGLAALSLSWWLHPPARNWISARLPPNVLAMLPVPSGADANAPKAEAKKKGPPPAPVSVASVVTAAMPVNLSAPGTVEAVASVAIKPRVDGQIAEVLFKEGDLVNKDQVLYRLDDRLIKAQILQAEATVRRDEASLVEAQANFGRRNVLVQKKIVSEAAMDTAKTSVETLKANIAAGKAVLEAQKTQLDYLIIKSPLRGRTGATGAKLGSNVRAADVNPLVTVNQTQPILVAFAVPQGEMVSLRRALTSGAPAKVTVAGPQIETRDGKIVFIDNQVDKQTGTLTAKIEVPNTDEFLWPGQAVEVVLTVETQKDKLAVPASAVLPSQQGMMVWVVGAENRAEARSVVLDRIVGQTAFLSSGVGAGETVIVDGQMRVASGATVSIQDPNRKGAPKGEPKAGEPAGKGEAKDENKKGAPKAEGSGQKNDRRS